ncbi:MAG: CoA-binding protein [Candidatus Zixiibacteriota bacterium]
MATKAMVAEFLAQRTLAVVGASREPRKFGNVVCRELAAKGYRVFAVNPYAQEIDGQPCHPSLNALPEPVGGAVIVVPPAQTEKVVKDAGAAGIHRVWMQRGSESPAALDFCRERGIDVVHGECILMFVEPTGFVHRVHRGLWGLFGKLPK